MWLKVKKFLTDHSAEAHAFAVSVVTIASFYATNTAARNIIDHLLDGHPKIMALLSLVVIYRSYASAHSEEARTRETDQRKGGR